MELFVPGARCAPKLPGGWAFAAKFPGGPAAARGEAPLAGSTGFTVAFRGRADEAVAAARKRRESNPSTPGGRVAGSAVFAAHFSGAAWTEEAAGAVEGKRDESALSTPGGPVRAVPAKTPGGRTTPGGPRPLAKLPGGSRRDAGSGSESSASETSAQDRTRSRPEVLAVVERSSSLSVHSSRTVALLLSSGASPPGSEGDEEERRNSPETLATSCTNSQNVFFITTLVLAAKAMIFV